MHYDAWMDISGPIREALRHRALPMAPEVLPHPLFFLVRMVALQEHPPVDMPAFLSENALPLLDRSRGARAMDANLAFAGVMRVLPRVSRALRGAMEIALHAQGQDLCDTAPALLGSRSARPADLLWRYWLLVLARKRLGIGVPEMLLRSLWRRAWVGQNKEGLLHPAGGEGSLEAGAYLDLAALHAAYNAIVFTQDYDLFPPVQRLVDAHVALTQPDHVTQEPWGLAAFAALDGGGNFAPQQVHDAMLALARLERVGDSVMAALLADAVLTQEETAAGLG